MQSKIGKVIASNLFRFVRILAKAGPKRLGYLVMCSPYTINANIGVLVAYNLMLV